VSSGTIGAGRLVRTARRSHPSGNGVVPSEWQVTYHVHLCRHAPGLSVQASIDQLARYCAHAADLGVTELALTEHSSRFSEFDKLFRGWWDRDPSPARRAEMSKSRDGELGADLDQYVEAALAAREAGLPVVVGLEVDYLPGQGQGGRSSRRLPLRRTTWQRALDRGMALGRPGLGRGPGAVGRSGSRAGVAGLLPVGGGHTILVTGDDTAGKYTLIDMHIPPGRAPHLTVTTSRRCSRS